MTLFEESPIMNLGREFEGMSYDRLAIVKEMHQESNFAHPESSRFHTLKAENRAKHGQIENGLGKKGVSITHHSHRKRDPYPILHLPTFLD